MIVTGVALAAPVPVLSVSDGTARPWRPFHRLTESDPDDGKPGDVLDHLFHLTHEGNVTGAAKVGDACRHQRVRQGFTRGDAQSQGPLFHF